MDWICVDTEKFMLFVPQEKLLRTKDLLEDLLKRRKEEVKVRSIAKVAGMIGSYTLPMGNVARFYTRGMLTQVAEVVNKSGWESQCVLEERVVREIEFWKKNIRSLNRWRMCGHKDVVYCKQGVVNMFSDASEFQLARARIEDS